MNIFKSIALAAALVLFSSCQDKMLPDGPDSRKDVRIFAASTENYGTKTSSDEEGNIIWNSGDKISVFEACAVNKAYKITEESAGRKEAELEPVDSDEPDGDGVLTWDNSVAYYPYSSSTSAQSVGEDYELSVNLPQTQQYVAGTFGNGCFPMVAVSSDIDDRDLKFKNILGCLKIQLVGTATIASVSVTGNNDEILCGPAVVTASSTAAPTIALSDADAKTVTLDCGEDGIKLNRNTPTMFVLALPPVTMANGFTIVITDIYGGQMQKTTSKAQVIGRSKMLKMPVFKYFFAEAVDLGLSVKWSSVNMGACRPGEAGDYYAWGETKAYGEDYPENAHNAIWGSTIKTHYSIYTYIFSEGTEMEECENNLTKYNGTDGKYVLDPEDDAAVQEWGDGWRMPTASEMGELMSLTWRKHWYPYATVENGEIGYEVVGRNGNTILLPFTSSRLGYDISGEGHGRYWTTELADISYAHYLRASLLIFNTTETMWSHMDRSFGNCIRPVKDY